MATKYVSTLTGTEMDSALTDMAYHNSEAYAVGTRNGVAVGQSDVTYHNNSKYWAEQVYGYTDRAEDAANRAEAAVPSGTAGAVFFDRAQTLTTAQQEQVRANIMAGGSNRNLLDNPWFTVNQRGQSSYTGRVYGVDRWIEYGSSNTVTVTSDGITLPVDTNSGFEQYFDDTFIQGKTVTISFMTADGTVTSKTATWPTSGANMTAFTNGVAFFFGTVVGKKGLAILTNAEVTLRAVKLELGSVSTLANDAPPDYGEELQKCQHYLYAVTFPGYAYTGQICFALDATNINWSITTPTPMVQDKLPSITVTNSLYANGVAISNYAIVNYPYGNNVKVSAQAGGLTNGQLYPITTSASEAKVLISTEP